MKFNGLQITEESILACRQWFADNAQACVSDVEQGFVRMPFHVLESQYKEKMQKIAKAALAGEYDHTFTFMQRAYHIQTGESVALLP